MKTAIMLMFMSLLFMACDASQPTRPRKTVQKTVPVHELTLKNYKKLKASTKYSFVPVNANEWTKGGFQDGTINWLT